MQQPGEIAGQKLIKGQMPDFWYSPMRNDTIFQNLTAHVPRDSDIPTLITLVLQADVPLTTTDVLTQFGPPLTSDDVKPGEPAKGIRYRRDWGLMAFGPAKSAGRIESALFLYTKKPATH